MLINKAFYSQVNRYLPACRHADLGHHVTSGFLCSNVSEKVSKSEQEKFCEIPADTFPPDMQISR